MATTLESLSAADRADFEKRLSTYGQDETAVLMPDLVVPAKTTMLLSGSDAKSFARPRVLSTKDLDELKSWIGVSDTMYQSGKLDRSLIRLPNTAAPKLMEAAVRAPSATVPNGGATVPNGAAAPAALSEENLDNVRTAAAAYLFGDSQLTASYKATVEKFFPDFQINFWPFLTITVNAGSILTIGPGQNVLCAWKIIINNGGMVYAPYGNLKLESTILQKI
jgi:hypothetical protein